MAGNKWILNKHCWSERSFLFVSSCMYEQWIPCMYACTCVCLHRGGKKVMLGIIFLFHIIKTGALPRWWCMLLIPATEAGKSLWVWSQCTSQVYTISSRTARDTRNTILKKQKWETGSLKETQNWMTRLVLLASCNPWFIGRWDCRWGSELGSSELTLADKHFNHRASAMKLFLEKYIVFLFCCFSDGLTV